MSGDDYIPCEICNELIYYNDYIEHCENCYVSTRITNLQNNVLSIISNNINNAINSNVDVSSFLNIVNALSEHFNSNNNYEFNLELQNIVGIESKSLRNKENAYVSSKSDDNCVICFEKMTEKNVIKTKCNHYYCNECIDKWFEKNSTCPICQFDFNEE